jgi:hypothetical protein
MSSIIYEFFLFDIKITLTVLHLMLFVVNTVLFIFSGKIIALLSYESGEKQKLKTWTFRFFNITFFILHLFDLVLTGINKEYEQHLSKVALTLVSFYTVKLLLHVSSNFIRRKFGDEKTIDGKNINVENYSTRMVNILVTTILVFINIVVVINIWGFNSLLETTGLIGIILGFFALTSSIWGPDLFHGLALLNSSMVEDGDIIELEGKFYIVFKTSFMETVLLNIANNHRTRIRNSNLANLKIDNLTKLAHAHGLRETIMYKVSYPCKIEEKQEQRLIMLEKHQDKMEEMLKQSFKECCEKEELEINENNQFECFLVEAGDFSLNYAVSFYVGGVKKTKFTHQARKILRTKHLVNEIIFNNSIRYGVDLSTPVLINSN